MPPSEAPIPSLVVVLITPVSMPPASPIVPSEVTPLRASTPKVQPRAYHPLN